jgi:large subunit ribosomal protein L1
MTKETDKETEKEKSKRRRPGHPKPRAVSRRHEENKQKVDKKKRYSAQEAVSLLKEQKAAKFDETIEVVMKLGIDTRKSDQLVRGSVSLPKGIGKKVKVLAFAEGDTAQSAKDAGADYVGGKELVEKIQKENWLDFDVAIAHVDMMQLVGKLGKILGPKGMMPSPKSGTVVSNIAQAVREFKAGKVEYRADSGGNVHAPVGKKSLSTEDLVANIETFTEHIKNVKPPTAKGTYIQKVVISSTMGAGIPLEIKR